MAITLINSLQMRLPSHGVHIGLVFVTFMLFFFKSIMTKTDSKLSLSWIIFLERKVHNDEEG